MTVNLNSYTSTEYDIKGVEINLEDLIENSIYLTWTNLTVTCPVKKSFLDRINLKKNKTDSIDNKDIIINGNSFIEFI